MRERPILFSGPMVRAILDGTKTQTRRVVKHVDPDGVVWKSAARLSGVHNLEGKFPESAMEWCPYGQPGDHLWVRESTHRRPMRHFLTGEPLAEKYDGGAYSADGADVLTPEGFDLAWWYSRKSCPSIHMPRFACRLVLEVTGVRVERLGDISASDCWAEGIEECDGSLDEVEICRLAKTMGRSIEDPQPSYAALWEQINGVGSWQANPWVWVMEFRISTHPTQHNDGGADG
jgi:hypothetical protein